MYKKILVPLDGSDLAKKGLEEAEKLAQTFGAEIMLFQVVKAAFGTRRKILKNALSTGGLQIDPRLAREALIAAEINPGRRAETLSVSEFIALQISLAKIFKSK